MTEMVDECMDALQSLFDQLATHSHEVEKPVRREAQLARAAAKRAAAIAMKVRQDSTSCDRAPRVRRRC